jgi:regulator of protease activity HflC (stomatin/prohibitin superfamily)
MNRRTIAAQTETSFALGCFIVIVIVVGVLGLLSFHPIDAGHVGVVTSFGKVQEDTLKPGLNILLPLVNSVTDVDTRVQAIPFDKDHGGSAASKEYQDVFVSGVVNIHVDQTAAVFLFQNVGLDYSDKLVIPFFANSIKEVIPQYNVGDVLSNREVIRTQTVAKLSAKLKPYGIIVDDVAISNIDFSDQYKQAIEAKQVAEQQVQTELQILAQAKIKADQVRASAQGLADAVVIAATAQSQANALLQKSLSPELIQYTLIQKLAPTIQTMILPSGQQFILDPKALLTPTASPKP